ncbi:MAG TPA: hypothetical protein VMX17_01295 [Candidatus Glassbacteria bacterium]|nr:hypothetical protein [Candidatus Glassbacteria bacterium]
MTPDQAKILAQIEQKLDDLCQHNANEHKELKSTINDIYKKVDEDKTEVYRALNNRPRWNVIMWLLGGFFLALVAVAGFAYRTDVKLTTHIEISKQVFHQLTGIEFDNRDGTETVKDDAD